MNKPAILMVGNFLSFHRGTRSVGEQLSSRLSASGWKIIETSHHSRRIFRLMDMLTSVVMYRKQYQIAYVEVYSGLAFYWAELVVRLLSLLHKPMILALHGGGLVEFAQRNRIRVTNVLQLGQIVVTPSLFLQTGLKPYHPGIRYLPNAVDIRQYKFQIRDHPVPKIVWLRAFHKVYQPDIAVRTLSCAQKYFDKATLIMGGPDEKDGSRHSALELARSLGVADHINIAGPIPKSEVPGWLASGDIFLNTTRFESFGVSVLEAALVGLPIVTTDVGELPYLWEHEKTAMLVPPNEPEAMANAIRRILVEPGFAACLSRNARLKAEQFDWSVILPQWESIFHEIQNG